MLYERNFRIWECLGILYTIIELCFSWVTVFDGNAQEHTSYHVREGVYVYSKVVLEL